MTIDPLVDPALDPTLDPRALSAAQWRQILAPLEYRILRESGTEHGGTGRYLDDPGAGAFHCVGCAAPLYGANHKFHSGCGWPSFFQQVEPGALELHTDRAFGMVRTEMRCARCGGHLGHIFDDAPNQPTGQRHCVNGYAILHVPSGRGVVDVFRVHRSRSAA